MPMRARLLILMLLVTCCCGAQIQDGIPTVIKCWRSLLASRSNITDGQLQLSQGNMSIGTDSRWLWQIFDAVVPDGSGYYYDPAQFNSVSSDYGLILFSTHVSPGQAPSPVDLGAAIAKYQQADHNYPWNKTISDLYQELNNSPGLCIDFDTVITNDTGCGSACAVTTIHIEARFAHLLIFSARPYAAAVTGYSALSAFTPWYTAGILSQFYKNENNWLSAEDWSKAFGPKGYLKRVCSSLLVGDSVYIRLEMTRKDDSDPHGSNCHLADTNTNARIREISTSEMYGPPALLGVIVSCIGELVY